MTEISELPDRFLMKSDDDKVEPFWLALTVERLGPDGRPFQIVFLHTGTNGTNRELGGYRPG